MTGNSTVHEEDYSTRKVRWDNLIKSLNDRIDAATTTDELTAISKEADESDLHWADGGAIIQRCLAKFKDLV